MSSGQGSKGQTKAKRVFLSLEKKIEVLEKIRTGRSLQAIAADYNIGYTTVRDIRDNADKISKFFSELQSANATKKRKTTRSADNKELDAKLYEWFLQQRAQGHPVSGPMLCEKAKVFSAKLRSRQEGGDEEEEETFMASQGWLRSFKERHGIRRLSVVGERPGSDVDAVREYIARFQAMVDDKGLCASQIYNADETGLFWKSLPSKTLASCSEVNAAGYKCSKEGMTVLMCANASGTHQLKLTCLGKSKKLGALKDLPEDCLPVHYYGQRKAWMDQFTFKDWFFTKFVPAVRDNLFREKLGSRAILVIDNAPAHPSGQTLQTQDGHITVEFLPPNVTTLLQPMDQGVTALFKCLYRKELLRKLLDMEDEDPETLIRHWRALSIKDALFVAASAWRHVRRDILNRCWKPIWPASFVPQVDLEEEDEQLSPVALQESARECLALLHDIPGCSSTNLEDVTEWLSSKDSVDPAWQEKTEEEILAGVGSDDDGEEEDEATAEEQAFGRTTRCAAAVSACDTLLGYLENAPVPEKEQRKLLIRRMRNEIALRQSALLGQTSMSGFVVHDTAAAAAHGTLVRRSRKRRQPCTKAAAAAPRFPTPSTSGWS
ncbi:jerky protein homolog-like [Lampetra planeri]